MSTKIPRDLTKEQAAPLSSGSRLVRLGGIGIHPGNEIAYVVAAVVTVDE